MDKQTASSLQRPEIRYLLILGCTVRGDQPTQLLQTRIDRAAQYLKLHPQTIAVASGGRAANKRGGRHPKRAVREGNRSGADFN